MPYLLNMKIYCTVFLVFISLNTIAQNTFFQKMHVGVNAGVTGHIGSLSQRDFKPGVGLQAEYEITDKIHLRLNGYISELSGKDNAMPNFGPDNRSANYYFHSNLNEISLLGQYEVFNINADRKFSPYVFGGVAMYHYKPYQKVAYTNSNNDMRFANLAMQQTHPFQNEQFSFPVGLGVKYGFTPNFRIFAEGNYRIMNNLLLDNFADDNKFDSYYSVNVGILFRLSNTAGARKGISGKDCDCPVY